MKFLWHRSLILTKFCFSCAFHCINLRNKFIRLTILIKQQSAEFAFIIYLAILAVVLTFSGLQVSNFYCHEAAISKNVSIGKMFGFAVDTANSFLLLNPALLKNIANVLIFNGLSWSL